MLVGNIVFMNFLIAVVNQSYESSMQRMKLQSLKSQLLMISAHYMTLRDEDFTKFPTTYVHPKTASLKDG